MFVDKLRKSILQAAIQGKLYEQLPTDGDARQLLREIQIERAKLIKAKKIKAAPPLPPISEDEIPFEIPANWCWARLGDIGEMYTGNSISEHEKKEKYLGRAEGFDFIATKDISFENEVAYNNGVKIPFENNFKRAKANSILLCIEGGSAGRKIARVNREVCFGNKLCNFTAYKNSNEYLYFYLQSPTFLKFFNAGIVGIIGGVGINKLKNFIVPLPPLAEQKRIAEKVSALLTEIAALAEDEKELAQLEKEFPRKMKASLLQAAIQGKLSKQLPTDGDARALLREIQIERAKLIKQKKIKAAPPLPPITPDEIPFKIPQNWCWARLGDIALKIHYGFTASANIVGNVKLLRITDIQNDKVDWEKVPRCNVAETQKKEYLLQENDLVIARTGGTVGKTFIVENLSEDAVFASYLIRAVFNKNISSKFIKFFSGSPLYWKQITDKAQGTGQPNVNGKSLSNLILPLPPLAEQKRIVTRLEELLKELEF